jgi:hypothetical protein
MITCIYLDSLKCHKYNRWFRVMELWSYMKHFPLKRHDRIVKQNVGVFTSRNIKSGKLITEP